ncbi:hypothetical protein [Sphingobacterium hungaricum]|uniref:hypothetical protein n=1 Tax=Sphingobacterium hungaricum TaxID=2082723 RepID=UPI0018CB97B6|nr:hypothetical protein [Sphingobacterium hungaricum]
MMMYNAVIPDYSTDNNDNSGANIPTPKTLSSNSEISLFNVGMRLEKGLGV